MSEENRNGNGEGMAAGPVAAGPASTSSMQFGFGEVAAGVIRMQVVAGSSIYIVDLPRATARQIAKNWIAECDRSESGLIVAPAGALPRLQ